MIFNDFKTTCRLCLVYCMDDTNGIGANIVRMFHQNRRNRVSAAINVAIRKRLCLSFSHHHYLPRSLNKIRKLGRLLLKETINTLLIPVSNMSYVISTSALCRSRHKQHLYRKDLPHEA